VRNKLSLAFFIIFGFCLIWGTYELAIRFSPVPLTFSKPSLTEKFRLSTALPVNISLPDTLINLPVIPVEIKNNRWPAYLSGISYVSSSTLPGEIGNSVFYGHDFKSLLGNLHSARPGENIYLSLTDGRQIKYTIARVVTVSPDDVSLLLPSDRRQLTLYTCTGFLDTKRLAVIAYVL
jgi:LPXTG-site transpeptidase (sortase) family protein